MILVLYDAWGGVFFFLQWSLLLEKREPCQLPLLLASGSIGIVRGSQSMDVQTSDIEGLEFRFSATEDFYIYKGQDVQRPRNWSVDHKGL